MEIREDISQRRCINYRLEIDRLKERRFVDFTHDGIGRMCRMYYNLRIKKYELEPIDKNA